jgi:hypothetical protein
VSLRKVFLFIPVLFFLTGALSSNALIERNMGGGFMDRIPRPRLISPDDESVDLSGKGELLFQWSPHEGKPIGRDYYDFRVYEGYEMLESTLLLKKKVPPREHTVSIEADRFRTGRVYTWSLRQVYRAMGKSDRSFSSFRVIRGREVRGKK